MKVSKVFGEDNIMIGVDAHNKKELFEEMVHELEDIDDDIDADEVLTTLWKREEMLNTRVAKGIAIPHTQVHKLKRTTGILAIAPKGVDYELSDGEKIQLVVMIIDDEHDTIEHLDTLRNFALLAKNSRFVEQLIAARTQKEAAEIIVKFETMLK